MSIVNISNTGNVGIGTVLPTAKCMIESDTIDVEQKLFSSWKQTSNGGVLELKNRLILKALIQASGDSYFNGGNVGIGTTTPTAPLHIEGGTNNEVLKIEADSGPYIRWIENGTNVGFLQFTDSTAYLSNMADGALQFRTNNTDKMTILSGGNVGIGTTGPGHKLDVTTSDASTWAVALKNTNANGYGLFVQGSETTNRAILAAYSGSSYKLWVRGDGNVGIGTTSPDFTLDVEKDVDTWLTRIYNTGSDANAQALLVRSDATSAHDALVMGVYADGGYKMVVRSTGNVGIGTPSPANKLQVTTGIGIGTTIGKNHLAGSLASGTSITLNANPAGGNNSAGLIVVSCVPNSASAGGAIGIWTGLHTQGFNGYTLLQQRNENNITIVESGGQYTITNSSGARAYYQLKVLNLTDFASTIGGF